MCTYAGQGIPLPGAVEWVDDGDFDLHQEIARASYADMLHDHERNEKYYNALKRAIEKMKASGRPANVLDIGTGTGLLSMMAARLGADSIVACEAFVPMAACAKEIIKENGFTDRIHLIPKRSTQIKVGIDGDMKRRANILVTEVFDSDFIGEGAIFTFKHALEELLEEDPIVVPSSGRVYVEIIESELARRWTKLNDINIDGNNVLKVPSSFEDCPGTYSVHDLQLSQFPTDQFKTLIEPQVVFSFDFLGKTKLEFNSKSEIECLAKDTGTAHAVFMWWDLTMDTEGDIMLSCAPHWAHPSPEAKNGPDGIPWRDHWMQEIYYLPKDVSVIKDETLNLISCHDEYGFWFNLVSTENKNSGDDKKLVQPACTCNLHMICSYSRIGMLNDPLRRDKYLLALKRKISSDSIILSIGDCSLLPLMSASIGAKKVYCQESCLFSKGIISEFIKTYKLADRIEFTAERIYERSGSFNKDIDNFTRISDVDLVITEPFFSPAFLPWHHIYWKPVQCSKDCSVFPSVSAIWAMPVNFDHLHKIRAPLHKVFDFSMSHFDQLVSSSSVISDSPIELQPLWEYGTTSLSYPCKLFEFDLNDSHPEKDIHVQKSVHLEATGRFDALVLWVEHQLDHDISISGGPVDVKKVEPGKKVSWDMYTKQAVYFVDQFNPITVNPNDRLSIKSIYKWKDNDVLLHIDLTCANGKEFKNVSGSPQSKFNYFKTEIV